MRAASVCARIRPTSVSGSPSSRPAVSTMVKERSAILPSPSRRSRVTPGSSSTSASLRPTSRLNSVDLPTFGRPMIATLALMLFQPGAAKRRLHLATPIGSEAVRPSRQLASARRSPGDASGSPSTNRIASRRRLVPRSSANAPSAAEPVRSPAAESGRAAALLLLADMSHPQTRARRACPRADRRGVAGDGSSAMRALAAPELRLRSLRSAR